LKLELFGELQVLALKKVLVLLEVRYFGLKGTESRGDGLALLGVA
jgi:hypothetical protein